MPFFLKKKSAVRSWKELLLTEKSSQCQRYALCVDHGRFEVVRPSLRCMIPTHWMDHEHNIGFRWCHFSMLCCVPFYCSLKTIDGIPSAVPLWLMPSAVQAMNLLIENYRKINRWNVFFNKIAYIQLHCHPNRWYLAVLLNLDLLNLFLDTPASCSVKIEFFC